jgi:hypothetical protein
MADKVAIDTDQFDRFRVTSPKRLHQDLYSGIEIEDHAARVSISYHALEPQKRRNPRLSRHRRHETVSGRDCMAGELRRNDSQWRGRNLLPPLLACCTGLESCGRQHTEGATLTWRNVIVAIGRRPITHVENVFDIELRLPRLIDL